MMKFLNIAKQNITMLKGLMVHINAHFITDTSQSWIFSNTKAEEGICEAFIHYISPENNMKMMTEQPLWKGYLGLKEQDEATKELFLQHIKQPIIHVILNVHVSYKYMTEELVEFIDKVLRKNNPSIEEFIIDTFIYHEVMERGSENI